MQLLVVLLFAALGAVAAAYLALVLLSPKPYLESPSELTFLVSDARSTPTRLPNLLDSKPTVQLSVVVPAYNEVKRISPMLRDTVQYLEQRKIIKGDGSSKLPVEVESGSYEIIVVDDGSRDGTPEFVLDLADKLKQEFGNKRGLVKVVKLLRNRGKGGATRHGVLHSSGCQILFADADGASNFPDLASLEAELFALEQAQTSGQEPYGIVVGSRAHLVQTEAVVKRSFLRNLLMRGFHLYLYILGIRSIRDTQCGFKLCTRATAKHLYPLLHSPSWIFDCELLLLAELSGIPCREVGIAWREVEGSKVDLIKDSIRMALDLLLIRGNYLLARWEKPSWVGVEVIEPSLQDKKHN